jgi:hypothetical protein
VTAPNQDAVIASYQQTTTQARDQLARFLLALWASLGVYRAAQMTDFVAQAVPVVEGAMRHMQALTAAYLAQFASDHPGRATPYPSATVGIRDVRNGAAPAEVYARPFHLVWRELGKAQMAPEPPADYVDKAIKAGSDRAVQLALTDVQLAKTHTAQRVLAQDHRVVGYRRVLEGAHSCGLCIISSTVRYHKGQLLPIHPACDCSVAPIIGDHDPGRTIDEPTLSAAHAAIRERFGKSSAAAGYIPGGKGAQYRDVLITHEHGELGPILAVRGQAFTGPNDL